MKESKVETKLGFIKYKTPNIPQRLRLLSKMGISSGDSKEFSLEMLADIIDNVESMVLEVSIKVGSKKISSWEECLDEEECTEIVTLLASDIITPQEKPEAKAKKTKIKKP